MADDLQPCPLTPKTVHLCVDMQQLFSEDGPWPTPWMARVFPVIAQIVQGHPERTVFSRFITPVDARAAREEIPHVSSKHFRAWMTSGRPQLRCWKPSPASLET